MILETTRPRNPLLSARTLLVILACLVAFAVPVQIHFVAHLDGDTHSDLYSP